MSGLFDTINARFAPGTSPAFRLRRAQRFEDSGGGSLEEIIEERPAPAAISPPLSEPAKQTEVMPKTAPAADEMMPPASSNTLDRPTPAPLPEIRSTPAEKDEARTESPLETPFHPSPQHPERFEKRAAGLSNETRQPLQISERVIEVQSQMHLERERIETRVAETPAMLPAEVPARPAEPRGKVPMPQPRLAERQTEASSSPPSVTVKIGRVEVTAPPKTAPAAPPRPPAPAPVQRSRTRHQKSGLTDYLGWKR